MWRFVVVTALLLAVCYGERLSSPSFRNFMGKYKKSYESEEEHNNRYWIFHRNMLQWEEMNRNELGTATYGMNKFADLSPEEFRLRYLSNYSISQLDKARYAAKKAVKSNVADMPDAVDWREKNAVTPVKDQGQCGSCWAFSTVANIEGRWAIKTGDLISLSEQEIVDCDEVNYGCDGGYPWEADKEISRLGGLVREESYEYTAVAGECKLNVSQVVVQVEGSEFLSRVEKEIAAHVAENGPVSALLNAKAMMWYEGGVSHPKVCKASGIDHAITIVGFGMDKKQPYWLIKNSWSTDWGENGYYRLYRGKRVCGINSWATTVVL